MKLILASVLLLAGSPAAAAPSYLRCSYKAPNGTAQTMNAKLDEAADSVEQWFGDDEDRGLEIEAQFSANKVSWNVFEVNRTSLRLRVYDSVIALRTPSDHYTEGTCVVVKSKRAI